MIVVLIVSDISTTTEPSSWNFKLTFCSTVNKSSRNRAIALTSFDHRSFKNPIALDLLSLLSLDAANCSKYSLIAE